jgi:hypothetical protein
MAPGYNSQMRIRNGRFWISSGLNMGSRGPNWDVEKAGAGRAQWFYNFWMKEKGGKEE